MADNAVPLKLELVFDDNGAVSKVQLLGAEAQKAGKKGQDSFDRAAASVKQWATAFLTATVAIDGARRAAALLVDSIQGAIDEQRQIRALSATMRDFGMDTRRGMEAVTAFSDKMLGMGQADDITRAAMQRILPVAGDVETAIKAATAAFVAARNRGRDYNELLDTMAALMAGSERGLIMLHRNFGIQVADNLEPADKFRIALGKIAEMYGDIAKLEVDAEDRIKSWGAVLDETRDGVGTAFLKQLNEILEHFEVAPAKVTGFTSAMTLGLTSLGPAVLVLEEVNKQLDMYKATTSWFKEQFGDKKDTDSNPFKITPSRDGIQALDSYGTSLESLMAKANPLLEADPEFDKVRTALKRMNAEFTQAPAAKSYADALAAVFDELEDRQAPTRPFWAPMPEQQFAIPGATDSGLGEGLTRDILRQEEISRMAQWEIDAQLAKNAVLLENERLFAADREAILSESHQLQVQHQLNMLDMASQFVGAAGALLGALGRQNVGFFRASQALRIAQATMDTYAAAVAAYHKAGGWPSGVVPAALSIAWGLAQVATIAAQKPPQQTKGQFHAGGVVPSTGSYVLERGEIVVPQPVPRGAVGGSVYMDFSGAYIDSEDTARALARMVERAQARGWN
ncbi:MAG: hypothetical protein ACOZEN_06860 [Thermodesulfobacteriota bacterium]